MNLLNSALVDQFSMLTFQRPLKPADRFDSEIYTDRPQAVVWAIGPLNSEGTVSYHSTRTPGRDKRN